MAVRRTFTQTKFFRALIIFGILAAFVWLGPQWLFAPARAFVVTVTFPVQKFFSAVAFEAGDMVRFFSSIGELKSENERLEKERLHLLAENARYADVSKENEELRRAVGLLPRDRFALVSATVIGRDAPGFGNWISIDRGLLQGIRTGMAVIVNDGIFVGRVTDVFPASARVMLSSNPDSLVNGVTLETDARGIVKGEYGLGLLFEMVLQTDTLQVGDTVVTSGLGGDIPQGLLIGTLQDVRFSDDRLFQQASLISPVKIDHLRYVFVIENVL